MQHDLPSGTVTFLFTRRRGLDGRRGRALGDKHIEATALEQLSGYTLREARLDDARRLLSKAYRVNRELDDAYRLPYIVCRFGGVLAAAGIGDTAARILSCGQVLLDELGSSEDWMERLNEQALASIPHSSTKPPFSRRGSKAES